MKADDEIEAFQQAQDALKETASKDTALLANAQQQAKSLLEEYIESVENATGKQYEIEWVYLDAEGNPA